jgi:multiple antibiotic resistance protein
MLLQFVTVFMGFFAIMNPVANVPIFLSLTSDDNKPTTARIARRAVLLAFCIVVCFAVAGKLIFELFGLSIYAFRITGGLLVFLIGFNMLQGNPSRVHHPRSADPDQSDDSDDDSAISVATFPLAMPILAGPGTIATAMNFSAQGGLTDIAITILTFGLLCGITYGFFVSGERLLRYLGRSALGVITRMMGLILAVIGTGMVIDGIKGAFALGI